jgi:hypothetical protein
MACFQHITGDVDFLNGPGDAVGEINVMRIPDETPAAIAQLAWEKLFAKKFM